MLLFFEKNLSTPPGQACSTCHAPEVAFTDPKHSETVSTDSKANVKTVELCERIPRSSASG